MLAIQAEGIMLEQVMGVLLNKCGHLSTMQWQQQNRQCEMLELQLIGDMILQIMGIMHFEVKTYESILK